MTIVLNLGLGMNPALVGLLGALPRLTDALTDRWAIFPTIPAPAGASGASGLAFMIGGAVICIGVLPAIFLRKRFMDIAIAEHRVHRPALAGGFSSLRRSVADFFHGVITMLKFTPFLKLCAATFLVFNGFMLVASFQFYVIIYHVFAGDQSLGAQYAGWAGTVSPVSTFCVIFLVSWMSNIPLVASAMAIWMIASYSVTQQKAHGVRQALERRRGPAGSAGD